MKKILVKIQECFNRNYENVSIIIVIACTVIMISCFIVVIVLAVKSKVGGGGTSYQPMPRLIPDGQGGFNYYYY